MEEIFLQANPVQRPLSPQVVAAADNHIALARNLRDNERAEAAEKGVQAAWIRRGVSIELHKAPSELSGSHLAEVGLISVSVSTSQARELVDPERQS